MTANHDAVKSERVMRLAKEIRGVAEIFRWKEMPSPKTRLAIKTDRLADALYLLASRITDIVEETK